jgi:hypothetical protein
MSRGVLAEVRVLTKEVLLLRVQGLAKELGRSPTQQELRDHGIWNCGGGGYTRTSDLLKAAGLIPRYARPVAAVEGRPDACRALFDGIRALAAELGRSPTHREAMRNGLWHAGKCGFHTIGALLRELRLPTRPLGVRVGSADDHTAVEVVDSEEGVAAMAPLAKVIAEKERQAAERLRSHNAAHPYRRRDDADLPPAWDMA